MLNNRDFNSDQNNRDHHCVRNGAALVSGVPVFGRDDVNTRGPGDGIPGSTHVVSRSNQTGSARELPAGPVRSGGVGRLGSSQWERFYGLTKEQAAQVSGVKVPH